MVIHFASKRGQPLYNGQNDPSQCVRYLEVPLYSYSLPLLHPVYENGSVFSPKILDIKTEDLLTRFMEGVANVAAVSLQIGYPTVASVPHSIVNGFKRLLAVAVATDITFPEAEQVRAVGCHDWGSFEYSV